MHVRTLAALLICCNAISAADVDLIQIRQLAQNYFRDSTEVPMKVEVSTVVTDSNGRPKRQSQSTVRMVFNGYNQGTSRFSLHANSGVFNTGALRDSLSGDLAAFFAGGMITNKDTRHLIEIRQPSEPGQPIHVMLMDSDCPALEIMPKYMFPRDPCGSATFIVNKGLQGGLAFQRFSFDSSGEGTEGEVPGLGHVHVISFHADVDFREVLLPGSAQPYLWPRETSTNIRTDKGQLRIHNRYSANQP